MVKPADAGLSAIRPGLAVLRSALTLVLAAFAILVLLPALITAQAAASL